MPVVEAVPPGSFLATLSDDTQQALRSAGRQRHCRRNSWILREGDRSEFVLLVLEGAVVEYATRAIDACIADLDP